MHTSPGAIDLADVAREFGGSSHRHRPTAGAIPPRAALLPTKLHRLWRYAYRGIAVGGCGVLLQVDLGCVPIFSERFRDAALPGIESGVNDIIDGFVDGIFAAVETRSDSGD